MEIEQLVKQHYRLLCAYAFSILENRHMAEDAVHDSLANVLARSEEIHSLEFLKKCVRNRCIDLLRKNNRSRQKLSQLQQDSMVVIPDLDLSYQEARAQIIEVRNRFNQATFQQQRALKLVFVDGNSYKAAAEIMGITINSFKTHLKYGLRKLRLETGNGMT